ncbi:hypothetical protein [Microbacterium sp. R86528]|uniref:hypothetical protein n=1 Tax=Microbacterium sp. R86528 TaxID=3093864 RepID=UPI0037CA49F7
MTADVAAIVADALASMPALPATVAELKGADRTRVERHAHHRNVGMSEALAELRQRHAAQSEARTDDALLVRIVEESRRR